MSIELYMYTGQVGIPLQNDSFRQDSRERITVREGASIDQRVWEGIVEEYYERIFAYCFQFLASRAEAEDATQQAFLKAYKSFHSLRSRAALKSWLYTIARNACIDRRRWWKGYNKALNAGDFREDTAATQELSVILRDLISRLPRRQREVFILRHWHECSTAETADILGIDQGSVKSHLSRAVKKLKGELLSSKRVDLTTD